MAATQHSLQPLSDATTHGNVTPCAQNVRLHWDIIAIVATFLSRSDISSVSKTCRILRNITYPLMASRFETPTVPSLLVSTQRLNSYLRFMTDDTALRAPWLRHLAISTSSMNVENLALFVKLLRTATNIESLALYDFNFRLERAPIDILKTLAEEVTSLRSLAVAGVGPRLHDMLQRLRAPIRNISLRYDIDVFNPCPFDSIVNLRNQDLSSVVLSRTTYEREVPTPEHVWPSVRELTLDVVYDFPLEPLCHAFPNLRSLIRRNDIFVSPHVEDEIRRRNEAFTGQWVALDYVSMSVHSLWLMAISCPIYRLEISIATHNEVDISNLNHILKATKPSILQLVLNDPASAERVLLSLPESATNIEQLEITLQFSSGSCPSSPESFSLRTQRIEAAILGSLPNLKSLRYLHLRPNGNLFTPAFQPVLLSSTHVHPGGLQIFMHHVAALSPSLEFVFVHSADSVFPLGWEVKRSLPFPKQRENPLVYRMSDSWASHRARSCIMVAA